MKIKILIYFTFILIISAVIIPYSFLIGLTLFGFIGLLILDRFAVKELGNMKFWIFVFIILIFIPVTIGEKDASFSLIKYSSKNLLLGIQMTLRSICIYTGVVLITRNISIKRITHFLERMGFSESIYVLPIGLNVVPIVRKNFFQIVTIFRLRGGFRRNRIRNLYKFLLALLINTIKMSEELAQIIELNKNNKKPSPVK